MFDLMFNSTRRERITEDRRTRAPQCAGALEILHGTAEGAERKWNECKRSQSVVDIDFAF